MMTPCRLSLAMLDVVDPKWKQPKHPQRSGSYVPAKSLLPLLLSVFIAALILPGISIWFVILVPCLFPVNPISYPVLTDAEVVRP